MTDTTPQPKLLPCPFCGGEAELWCGSPGCWFVACAKCKAMSDDRGREAVIRLWNTRTPPAAPELSSNPLQLPAAPAEDAVANYQVGDWFVAKSIDEMQAFYLARLPFMRQAARECGWALGLHGSTRRDLDLIAVPWREDASTRDELAAAIQMAACGMKNGEYNWHPKPNGRVAECFPICCPSWPECFKIKSIGHVDLSVMDNRRETMTEAELEREIDAILADTFSEVWRMANGHFKARIIKLAKKFRG